MRLAISCLACVVAGHALLQAVHPDARPRGRSDGAAALIERFLSSTDVLLTSPLQRVPYAEKPRRAAEGIHARLTAWTTVDPVEGFRSSIVQEDGSGFIRRKVLRAALEAERSMRDAGEMSRGALTGANYEFTPAGRAEERPGADRDRSQAPRHACSSKEACC